MRLGPQQVAKRIMYESVRGGKEIIVDKSKGDSDFKICLVPQPATLIPD
jgi:hypothetical protein